MLRFKWLNFLEKFEEWDPELSIQLLKVPSLPNYSGFRKLIENAKPSWMEDFLERDGLAVLFDRLEKLSTSFSITKKHAKQIQALQTQLCLNLQLRVLTCCKVCI